MNLQEQISRIKSMMGLIIEDKEKSNKPVQIFKNGGGSDFADKYQGNIEKIPVIDTVRNEPFKDMSYMKEKGKAYIDALNNGEEWMNKPIVAIVHPYDSSKYVVVDGNHRLYAYKETNTPEVNAIIVPHEDVVLMKSEWGDENEESINLTDVIDDKEVIDKYFVKPDGTNNFNQPIQEQISRIQSMMGLEEQSYLEYLSKRVNDGRRKENPYNEKEYNPNNDGDFSHSEVKDVVWRAGEMRLDSRSGGLWFAETKDGVEKFALSVRGEKREGKSYYINLQNPKYYDSFWHGYLNDSERHGREGLMDMLVADGHDGIVIGEDTWNDTGDENSVTSKQYVVFNPENIKPA